MLREQSVYDKTYIQKWNHENKFMIKHTIDDGIKQKISLMAIGF